MFIIDDIISWLIGKLMDRVFPAKKENKDLAETLISREREIGKLKQEKAELISSFNQEKDRVIDSLKRRGISTEKLINKYDKPLFAILISYASQKELNDHGKLRDSSFIRVELEKYGSKYLGGTDAIIPPTRVPKGIQNSEDLQRWFEKSILKGRYCKVKFLSLIDLKRKSFWKTYLPYEQKDPIHRSIGEVLKIDDLFTEEDIKRISISEIIKEGDILWLASSILDGKELDKILRNQKKIEKSLGNPSLRELAEDQMLNKLTASLSGIVSGPGVVSQKIINEAKFWNSKLI